ncbi:MAG: preprotein translocase subunit Sec61beta [Candidatus Altiarchaeota archaeon]|nr:preprotein translocase subunit Sec61beta [Candidatus Altiarchaeota archaeon]MBU4341288.1 preprotein translocase subunit Sec61beta [Candidatus Altiarchaeota archaeon]MBU4406751.1 preprotein translocase subunit Sec61beta [Candidatus Altiarchaeota archaeon]MBU4437685.1 preprotein translocase subunit Sec61beta [Candidatus Altiarchaeota archaeon]
MKKREYGGPAGGAGLIRYFDVDEGGPKMDPKFVLGIVIAVLLLVILMNMF